MLENRSTARCLVLSLVVCLLLGAILSAEIPELLTLTDHTFNDFTIRKGVTRERIPTMNFAVHKSISSNTLNFKYDLGSNCASLLADGIPISSDLIILHSVFRR